MAKLIELGGIHAMGRCAIVDDDDYEWLNQWRWYCNYGYAVRTDRTGDKQRTVRMHRQIMTPPADMDIDHIDHNRLNNQRSNLRLATRQENSRYASKPPGKSPYRGVVKNSSTDAWEASITVNREGFYLGYFPTQFEAAQAYNEAAIKHHGEFAILNDLSAGPMPDDLPLFVPNERTASRRGIRKARERWHAYIYVDGEYINLGYFSTEIAAIEARDDAEYAVAIGEVLESLKLQKPPKSQYRGVKFEKRVRKWYAEIHIKRKRIYLGSFDSEIEAAKAYDAAARAHFLFERLNFPDQ